MKTCECCPRMYEVPVPHLKYGYDGSRFCSLSCATKAKKGGKNSAAISSVSGESSADLGMALLSIPFKLVWWIFKLLGKLFGKLYKWVFSKSIKTPLGIILRIIFVGIPIIAIVVAGFIIWKRIGV